MKTLYQDDNQTITLETIQLVRDANPGVNAIWVNGEYLECGYPCAVPYVPEGRNSEIADQLLDHLKGNKFYKTKVTRHRGTEDEILGLLEKCESRVTEEDLRQVPSLAGLNLRFPAESTNSNKSK